MLKSLYPLSPLRLFSEQSKLKILLLLYYNGSLPVCVKTLKASGLVEYERVAKYGLYRLTNYTIKIIHIILETIIETPLHNNNSF